MTHKTEAQPEALRLAQFFESLTESSHRWWDGVPVHEKAATVLRALVTEIEQIKAERASQTNRAEAAEQQVTSLTQRLDTANALNTEARNQLAQLSARQAAPEGWRLVPVEPDSNMKRAAQKASMDHSPHREWLEEEWPDGLRMWNGMLSAAPPPPERKPQSQEWHHNSRVESAAGLRDALCRMGVYLTIPTILQLVDITRTAHGIGATNDNP
ncbi:hypothetical protein [Comamonas odontotermitis]|uniref:hypothetical protein n=1 Tax=Comamonas odontotermitis TaxID=379895 RepID=UPI0037507789